MRRALAFSAALFFLVGPVAADVVTMASTYPLPYGEYKTLRAMALGMPEVYAGYAAGSLGGASFLGGPGGLVTVNIHGNLALDEAQTDGGPRYSKLHVGGTGVLRVAPGKGSYGNDALRIAAGPQVYISSNSTGGVANPLKVWGTFRANMFGQNEYQGGVLGPKPYIRLQAADTLAGDDASKRAYVSSVIRNLVTSFGEGDLLRVLYAHLFIEGSPVYLGAQSVTGVAGNTQYVLVNTEAPLVVDATKIFQVNGNVAAGGFLQYSSAVYKTNIETLAVSHEAQALRNIESMPVYRFRYKNAPDSKLHIGVIADEAPSQMLGADRQSLDLQDASAYVAAALKELQRRNDNLKKRLVALEELKERRP